MSRRCLLVLANSFKLGGRCVAGREVLPGQDRMHLGPWLRPVSRHGDGELDAREQSYHDGRPVAVLDVAEVTLAGPAPCPFQPENWSLDSLCPWRDLSAAFPRPHPELVEEHPEHLWLEPGNRPDRVSCGFFARHPPGQSLHVIRPENPRIGLVLDSWRGQPCLRRRCLFRYRGVDYDLSLTDPRVLARYERLAPRAGEPPVEAPLPDAAGILLCVSLAHEFHGHHYKVVATVIEGTA